MLSNSLFSKLPLDIIKEILLYDSHFVRRNNNRIVCIHKIPRSDFRYKLLDNIPKIYEISKYNYNVIIGKNKKYMIRHYLKPNHIWEYYFIILSKDMNANIIYIYI